MYGCCGRSKTRDRVAFLDDLAGIHHADSVAHRADDAEVVGDQQDCRVHLGDQRAHEIEHARLDGRIEPGRRLVEDEQLRVRGQRDGDDDALLHATRQLVRIALVDALRVGDLDAAHRRERALARLARALAEHGVRLGDLRTDLGRRVQRGSRVLVDHRRAVRPELTDLLVVHPRDVLAADEDAPAGDDGVARADSEAAAYAVVDLPQPDSPTRPYDSPGLDVERHAAQDRPRGCRERCTPATDPRPGGRRAARSGLGRRRGERFGSHSDSTDWSESAMKLMATTVLAMASAGNSVDHHTPEIMYEYSSADRQPPVRRGRLDTDAQE